MDPLSDVLPLLKPRIVEAGGFDLAGAWSIGFPQHQGIKCYAVALDQCWVVCHIEERRGIGLGWLFALADPQLRRAIEAIHADPARQFAERVGQAPIEYVTGWGMMLAADRLNGGGEALTRIARSLGYASDSAFCAAFRRVMGCSAGPVHSHGRTRFLTNLMTSVQGDRCSMIGRIRRCRSPWRMCPIRVGPPTSSMGKAIRAACSQPG